ncbi:hypothetical protein D1007_37558 [Hordeum vulgare]|uniref:GRF-type domain-containing protein n=1 Tax=Hordeum vulgare subsp. vulgare TaxID=112509 RepID=A0A8I6YMX8_HORVV|nr:hypothetical protein D1007_37558 [Hordeum vulgare]
MASSGSSIFSSVVAEVDGVGIVEHVSEFYFPDESYCGLEHSSKHRCPGHDRVPARRVAWGGANTGRRFFGCPLDLPDECHWVVWVDPPPPLHDALAFEYLHAELEQSWMRSHKMQKQNMELLKKNLALKKKLRERDEMLLVLALLFVGMCVVVFLVL